MINKLPSKKTVLVSIIMPVYNAEQYLDKAINSILNQTYPNIELFIVDDCSTDKSFTIAKKYKKKYPNKIHLIQPKKNINKEGDAGFNLAMNYAKGSYIARMDADDIAEKNRIKKQVSFLEKHKDIFLVGGQALVIDKEGREMGMKAVPTDHESIYNMFFQVHPIIHPTVMFRNEKPRQPFYFEKFEDSNDYYTFFTLLMQGKKLANLPDILLKYRIHGLNSTVRRMKQKLITTIHVRQEMMKKYGYKPSIKEYIPYLVQLFVAMIIPNKFLIYLYYLLQNKRYLEKVIQNIKNRLNLFHQKSSYKTYTDLRTYRPKLM